MIGLRRLNDGKWNRDPVLTAARAIIAQGLKRQYHLSPLGKMATFVNGTSYDVGQLGTGETPVIRISNITNPKSDYLRTGQGFAAKFHVAEGDLLVSWSASFKSILWPGPAGILNQHIFNVVEKPDNDRNYVRHAIEAAFVEMQRNVVGIGMMHLRRGDFLGHAVPCPEHEVQIAVGRYLDWIETACSGPEPVLPANLERERESVDQIRRVAAMLDEATLLRREASMEINALIGASLNDMSERFAAMKPLEEVLNGKPRNGWSPRCDNALDGVPVLTLSAVTGFQYNSTTFKRTSLPVDRNAHYWLNTGDLLITRSNTAELVGHAAIYDGSPAPCIYSDLMMRIPLDMSRVVTRFCWYWLQTPLVRDFLMKAAKGTSPTMKKISQGTVMAIPFPTSVPISEQRAIVEVLDALAERTGDVRTFQQDTDDALTALLPALIDQVLFEESPIGQLSSSLVP